MVASEHKGFIKISISDSGIGIPQSKQAYIFHLFGKLDGNDEMNPQGSGLGLGISNLLAIELGGKGIEVSSKEGCGSTFSFRVRVEEEPWEELESPTIVGDVGGEIPDEVLAPLKLPRTKGSSSDISQIHPSPAILIVDDNEFNRLVLSKLLASLSLSTSESSSGLQALSLITQEARRRHYYRLVLMDLEMPEMDGMTAAGRIIEMREKGEIEGGVKVVACSAYSSKEDKAKCYRAGMDGYLEKPVSKESICTLLRDLLIIH